MSGKKRVKAKESTYGRRDVARDDDFLSDTLLADLVPNCKLLVHHAWGHGRHTYDEPVLLEILNIVRKYVVNQSGNSLPKDRVKEALRHFAELEIVKRHLRGKDDRERSPFLTHANRYLQVYLPSSHFEFVPTDRYTWHTDKNELAVRATAPFDTGKIISGLCGVLVALTNEENEELRGGQDFSIVVNVHTKRFFILLGPARFVNHDCNPNVKMKREGKSLTFEVIRPIKAGEEILSSYGENYFGEENCECLCESCERTGSGMFAKDAASDEEGEQRSSASVPRRDSSEAAPELPEFEERKTRRGTVFWRAPAIEDETDEEEEEEDGEEGGEDAEHPELDVDGEAEEKLNVSTDASLTSGLADVSHAAEELDTEVSILEFALVPPDENAPAPDRLLPTPEATPTHELPKPRLSLEGVTRSTATSLSVTPLDPALLSPASLTLSDEKPVLADAAPILPTPPSTSSEGTPSDTAVADSLADVPIGFAVLEDDDLECPWSPVSSALSSALSEVPSDFDEDEAMHDILGSLRSRPGSPAFEPIYIRPETPPGDNCAAVKCGVPFSEKEQPVGKWCMRCARHFKIFQVQWPHRTGERRLSPRLPGPPVWSRGRQVFGSPPVSRETSVSSQRQKRKAKEASVDIPKPKKSRLSKVVTAKKIKRTYTRRAVREGNQDSEPDSEDAEEDTDAESEGEDHDLESEDHGSEEEQDSEAESEGSSAETEESEEEIIREPVKRGRPPKRPTTWRGHPVARADPPSLSGSKSSLSHGKAPRGRPRKSSPKVTNSRKATPSSGRGRQGRKSHTPAGSRKRVARYGHSPSPSPSPSRSPSPAYGLRSHEKSSTKSKASEAKASASIALKTTQKRGRNRQHRDDGELVIDLTSSRGSRSQYAESDEEEVDSDVDERPTKKHRRCGPDGEMSPPRETTPPRLAMYRPLNGLHISPRGGSLFISPPGKAGPPKKTDSYRIQVPQPPIWWASTSAKLGSDLAVPAPSQRPKWAPPPPPRELPTGPSPTLTTPLSPGRSFFGTSSIHSPTMTGPLISSIGTKGSSFGPLNPMRTTKAPPFGLGIQGSSALLPSIVGLGRINGNQTVPISRAPFKDKEVIVLSSDEDDDPPPPKQTQRSERVNTPNNGASNRASNTPSSSGSANSSGRPPRMSGDARLVYEAKMAGIQTRNAKKSSGGKRTTKAALGMHRNE